MPLNVLTFSSNIDFKSLEVKNQTTKTQTDFKTERQSPSDLGN